MYYSDYIYFHGKLLLHTNLMKMNEYEMLNFEEHEQEFQIRNLTDI